MDDDVMIWQWRKVAEVADTEPGTHLRVRTVRNGTVEGSLIGAGAVTVGGQALGVRIAVRTPVGRTELVLAPTDTVEVLSLRPTVVAMREGEVPRTPEFQLRQVDRLVGELYTLSTLGTDAVRGFQSPAITRAIGALEAIRRGSADPLAGLPGTRQDAGR
jgi:hypothetical protein